MYLFLHVVLFTDKINTFVQILMNVAPPQEFKM